MREIHRVIESGEKVFWEGQPKFWPFFISSFFVSLIGFIFMIFTLLFGFISGFSWAIFLIPHFWIGLAIFVGAPLYKLLVYSKTHYAITNKRVIFQGGVIGRDFKFVDFDKITNAEVNVGLTDILFGGRSGSILVFSAGTFVQTRRGARVAPYRISHVANPYEIFKFFKKVSHDVKTDVHFPNKYRPKNNPGYSTNYEA